jgi:hypothetical protein
MTLEGTNAQNSNQKSAAKEISRQMSSVYQTFMNWKEKNKRIPFQRMYCRHILKTIPIQ